jgi:hypothetical protein
MYLAGAPVRGRGGEEVGAHQVRVADRKGGGEFGSGTPRLLPGATTQTVVWRFRSMSGVFGIVRWPGWVHGRSFVLGEFRKIPDGITKGRSVSFGTGQGAQPELEFLATSAAGGSRRSSCSRMR